MNNYKVTLEAAWLVKDIETVDDAMGVAIAEAGKRLNPQLEYVEINIGTTYCPSCDEPFDSVFMAADTALVGLFLEMRVFDAENDEHAARIAKSVIGKALKNIPLAVIEVIEMEYSEQG
ncbi:MAG: DUF555 domain-containing protein [Methanosarcinales archaeon]|nr:DUF555 domain-containing protein [Methanosarcinales archaeon]